MSIRALSRQRALVSRVLGKRSHAATASFQSVEASARMILSVRREIFIPQFRRLQSVAVTVPYVRLGAGSSRFARTAPIAGVHI